MFSLVQWRLSCRGSHFSRGLREFSGPSAARSTDIAQVSPAAHRINRTRRLRSLRPRLHGERMPTACLSSTHTWWHDLFGTACICGGTRPRLRYFRPCAEASDGSMHATMCTAEHRATTHLPAISVPRTSHGREACPWRRASSPQAVVPGGQSGSHWQTRNWRSPHSKSPRRPGLPRPQISRITYWAAGGASGEGCPLPAGLRTRGRAGQILRPSSVIRT